MAVGQSTTGDVVNTGKMMVNQVNSNTRRGPGVKNLGPSANKQVNPTGTVRSLSPNLMGPDKGAGGK